MKAFFDAWLGKLEQALTQYLAAPEQGAVGHNDLSPSDALLHSCKGADRTSATELCIAAAARSTTKCTCALKRSLLE